MSIACPFCGRSETIIWTWDKRAGVRTRYCHICQVKFRTVEVAVANLPDLVNDNGRVRERQPGTPISSIRLPILGRLDP